MSSFACRPVFLGESSALQHMVERVHLGWARSSPELTSIDVFEVVGPGGLVRGASLRLMVPQENVPSLQHVVKQVELAVRSRLDELPRPSGVTALQFTALTVAALRTVLNRCRENLGEPSR